MLCLICNVITLFTFFFAGHLVSGLITFSLYALVWSLIWRALYVKDGISQFPLKLIFATLPLIVFTAIYIWRHPTPNYLMMIPLLPSEIHFYFATAITGTVLFPWYSLTLKRLFSEDKRWVRYVWRMSPIAAAGVVIFTFSYNLLPSQW